jgi:tetratricopeptide (TPR) repeat protein
MRVDEHEQRANQEVETQQYEAAIHSYRLSLKNDSGRIWLLNDIAWCYFCLEKYELALLTCDEALASDMDANYKSIAFLWKGKALERMGLASEALDSFDKGLAFECYSINLLWAKGRLLASLDRPDEARAILRECRTASERDKAADEEEIRVIQARDVERKKLLESIETDINGIIDAKFDA